MFFSLANAEPADQSFASLRLVIYGSLTFAVLAVAAFIPIRLALRRQHLHAQTLIVLTILCALSTLASILYTLSAAESDAREKDLLLKSGYYDSHQHSLESPSKPWPLWGALSLVYAGLLTWSLSSTAIPNASVLSQNGQHQNPS